MNELSIREAVKEDLKLISVLAITTNYEAYFNIDDSEHLADYCVRFFNLETIKDELENPKLTYLIAEFEGKAVGFAQLREGKKIDCMAGKNAIEIQRIYVVESMKGRNIGKALIEKCREFGRNKGYTNIWLGVWDKNIKAQKFYDKIGMKKVGLTDFSDGKNEFLNFVYLIEI